MARHRAVRRFGFHCFAVRRKKNGRHQAKRTKALRNLIRLNVAVVIFAGPDKLARPFQGRCDHIINQTVFVNDIGFGKFGLKLSRKHFGKQILKAAIIGFEDRVLGREIKRPSAIKRIIHAGAGKIANGIVKIIHAHRDAGRRKIEYFLFDTRAVCALPDHLQLAGAGNKKVRRLVLIAKRMTADDNRVRPTGDQTGDIADDDRFAKYHAAQDVADGAVRRFPHLF